jgi:hypothetical protein
MNPFDSVVLTDDEVALIEQVIVPYEIGTHIGALLKRAAAVPGGRRIRGTDQELDELLGAVWSEVRGFHRLDEERAGRGLDDPVPGSFAARLATIYDKIEQYLS